MANNEDLTRIYHGLKDQYSRISRPILNGLWDDSVKAELPKVMFPPNEGSSFDAQVAESGFLQRNCAIISAFRRKNPDGTRRNKQDNLASSLSLENDLKERNLAYFKVDGCFREHNEARAFHEVSFFVYDDGDHFAKTFFVKMYELSEKYNQDSFLYKGAGMSRFAFFISTNDISRAKDGDVVPAGKLYLNLPPVGPYSNLGEGNGRITFKMDEPTEEELEYARNFKYIQP